MIVMKRDGREDQYTKTKIHTAISKAMRDCLEHFLMHLQSIGRMVVLQD